MKKMIGYMLVLVMLLNLTACQPSTGSDNGDTATTTVPTTTTTTPPVTYPLTEWAHDLPKMDGSTSTIPLEAGIRAALFGVSLEEAETAVTHNSTYGSYNNLVNGDCDLIFTVQMSQEQISEAAAKGVELEQVPIAAEGFVFVVNAKNPVDTLTQEQLRGIYSGEITNWKEVGGNDAPIAAYQRNETSGSQNYIKIFMGDTPLMEPITEFTPISMGSLMDAVAYYDNAENAIGYSVYAYAADMYGNGDEIKFIHVDGVEPTKDTMADGSYPLLSYNYIVFNKAQPADSVVLKLADWVLTDDGQRAVKAAGYVPLRPVGEVEEHTVSLYNAVGTGPEKPEGHVPSVIWCEPYLNPDSYSPNLLITNANGERLVIDGLADEAFEAQINADIAAKKEEILAIAESDVMIRAAEQCINGYLSVEIYTTGAERVVSRTLLYDLVAKKRIAYSDLYFKGEDFLTPLNQRLREQLQKTGLKRGFVGLEAGHDTFTFDEVIFNSDSAYTIERYAVYVRGLYSQSVLSLPRDLSGVFADGVALKWSVATESAQAENLPLFLGRNGQLLQEGVYDEAVTTKVNRRLREIYTEMDREYFTEFFGAKYNGAETEQCLISTLSDRYFWARATLFVSFVEDGYVPSEVHFSFLFDRETGEEVPFTVLLNEGWQEEAKWYIADEETLVNDDFLLSKDMYGLEEVTVEAVDDWTLCCFEIQDNDILLTFNGRTLRDGRLWARVPLSYLK